MSRIKTGLKSYTIKRLGGLKPRVKTADEYEKITDKVSDQLGLSFRLVLYRDGGLVAEYSSVEWFEIDDLPTGESFRIGSRRP